MDKDTEESFRPLPKSKEPDPMVTRITEKLGEAVNEYCTCGGRGPEDSRACPACLIWHEMKEPLSVWL
jgi:hypothetical protein